MHVWTAQVRKGLVELWVLAALSKGESYGYQLLQGLAESAGVEISESTVYPILARLTREGWVTVRSAPSPAGPRRRYYRLTPLGVERLEQMTQHWEEMQRATQKILKGGRV